MQWKSNMAEGPNPMMTAEFHCKKCDNGWISIRSINLPEKCDKCHKDCDPTKYRPATHLEKLQGKKMKMVAKYKCNFCGKKFRSTNSSGIPKACPNCRDQGITNIVPPYRYQSVITTKPETKKKKGGRHFRRMFGTFECVCGKEWKSANAWEGMKQQCKDCMTSILPSDLRPLEYGMGGEGKRPHQQDLCEMCQRLGHRCTDFTPKPPPLPSLEGRSTLKDLATNEENHPDDESVVSTQSESSIVSIISGNSSESRGSDDSNQSITPVPSDTLDILEAGMDNLDIND